MTTIHNEIKIQAPIAKIWQALSSIEELDKFDPTVKRSKALSEQKSGAGSKRKVDMKDGKNWFEEECTVFKQHEVLAYELRACSFPIHNLKHSYSFQEKNGFTTVKQTMVYTVKFGLLGKLLDALMIRRQTATGIKKFMAGLKSYTEN